jgi:hypothetical protein
VKTAMGFFSTKGGVLVLFSDCHLVKNDVMTALGLVARTRAHTAAAGPVNNTVRLWINTNENILVFVLLLHVCGWA